MDYSVFDRLLDAVMIVNSEKELVYCNEAMAGLIGISLKRLKVGKKAYDFITFDDPDVFCMPEGKWGKSEATLYREFDFKTKKQNEGCASVAIRPMEQDGQMHWIHFMRDMSLEIQLQKKYRTELHQKESVIDDLKKAKVELENYSKNLEKMVSERTEELRKSNQFVNTMINSLGQGLLVFDRENNCLPIYTKACDDLFYKSPKDASKIWDLLNFPEDKVASFEKWSSSVFSEIIPFEDLADLGPNHFIKDDGEKYIGLEYHPFKTEDGGLEGIVTVATDKTFEHEAKIELLNNQQYVAMILKMVRNKNQFLSFVKDSRAMLEKLKELCQAQENIEEVFSEILLLLHSIKGGAGVYSIQVIHDLAHELEDGLDPYKKRPIEDFKEYLPSLSEQFEMMGRKLEKFFNEYRTVLGEGIVDGKMRLELVADDLKDFSEKMVERDIPYKLYKEYVYNFIKGPAFKQLGSYSELVVDLAVKNNKKMNPIKFVGKKTRIESGYYSELFNNLVHAFTNAVVHGLEESAERLENGKDESGQIIVSFLPYIDGGQNWLKMTIEDDGRGISPEIVKKKLIENGVNEEDIPDNKHELVQYIFEESFSTAANVNSFAGRGVGMGAIKSCVEKMGGRLHMETYVGLGSKLVIDVPDAA